jgi:hypothetical protein
MPGRSKPHNRVIPGEAKRRAGTQETGTHAAVREP